MCRRQCVGADRQRGFGSKCDAIPNDDHYRHHHDHRLNGTYCFWRSNGMLTILHCAVWRYMLQHRDDLRDLVLTVLCMEPKQYVHAFVIQISICWLTWFLVGSSCGNLWLGYAYCVKGPASSSTTTAGASAPTQSGIASNCDEYHTVVSGDSCAAIETQYNDTFTELYQWNPAIGSSCQNLWVGYAICVGVS